ncbi:uncharacterized protein [Venturia canescens]|uniref:uncharacterized protein n=1 Tax=Venturia canescens TaxID=32260 RepID=UPI001C9CE2CE|nr:uncharacterized protein LOC122416527 [Venturia canescens]
MNRGGRPSHRYWIEGNFKKVYENKKLFALCQVCNKTIRHSAERRLRDHRKFCQGLLTVESVEDETDEIDENVAFNPAPITTPVAETNANNYNNDGNKKALPYKKRKRLDAFFDRMSLVEKTTLDTKLIKFLCGCHIPLEVLNSTHFKNFMTLLRPAYDVPSTQDVNNNLLNSVYQEVTAHSSTSQESSDGVLMMSELMGETVDLKYVLGIVHRTPQGVFHLKIWSIPKNETDITDIVKEAIQISKEEFNVIIYAVIATDDFSISSDHDCRELWVFKCQTTIVEKMINSFKIVRFILDVRSILRAFQTPRLREEVISRGGVEIEVADDEASIVSLKDMFTNCLKNQSIFHDIVSENVFNVPENALEILSSMSATSFEEELQKFIVVSEHFNYLNSECQRPSSTMCDMIERWLQMESLLSENGRLATIKNQIPTILSPTSIVANNFHPAYRGLTFANNAERNVMVLEYLLTILDDQGLDEFYEFSNKKGLFEKLEARQIKDAEIYWDFAQKKYPTLANIAKKLIRVPASVVKLKLQSISGNDIEKDNMMVELYYRLKLQDDNITDKY